MSPFEAIKKIIIVVKLAEKSTFALILQVQNSVSMPNDKKRKNAYDNTRHSIKNKAVFYVWQVDQMCMHI